MSVLIQLSCLLIFFNNPYLLSVDSNVPQLILFFQVNSQKRTTTRLPNQEKNNNEKSV